MSLCVFRSQMSCGLDYYKQFQMFTLFRHFGKISGKRIERDSSTVSDEITGKNDVPGNE